MKKLTLIFALVMWSFTSFCQTYYPIVEDNKIWNVLNINLVNSGPPSDTTFNTESYKIHGDTSFNNITYSKLYSTNEKIAVNWTLWGLIR